MYYLRNVLYKGEVVDEWFIRLKIGRGDRFREVIFTDTVIHFAETEDVELQFCSLENEKNVIVCANNISEMNFRWSDIEGTGILCDYRFLLCFSDFMSLIDDVCILDTLSIVNSKFNFNPLEELCKISHSIDSLSWRVDDSGWIMLNSMGVYEVKMKIRCDVNIVNTRFSKYKLLRC